jgi:hypothetical protein
LLRKMIPLLLLFALFATVQAQTTRSTAAILAVRFAPVEVKRAGTETWIALSAGAEMPFSSGDAVRTSADSGRASLTFAGMRWLILPNSEVTLDHYVSLTVDEAFIEAHVTGVIVSATSPSGAYGYTVHTPKFTVTKPGTLAALWTSPEWPDSYIVAEGSASLALTETPDTPIHIEAGEGFYAGNDQAEPLAMDAPYNAARLQSALYGCPAVVTTRDNVGLIVRRGPAQAFDNLDILLNGNKVFIIGQTETSGWSRIQYLSGFSWMFTRALDQDESCTRTPPVFADDSPRESIITAFNTDEDERTLLRPFFGAPDENYLFYRTRAR